MNTNNSSGSVKRLVKCFFSNSMAIDINDVEQLQWEDQNMFLNLTFLHPIIVKYPINMDFARMFLKKLINILEHKLEIHDRMYVCLCQVMNNLGVGNICYKHYLFDNDVDQIITILETQNMVVNGTTGMRTWEAGMILADWATTNREEFCQKNILELGSGVGFAGITIAKHCNVNSIYLTDCHDDVLQTIGKNIEINFPDSCKSVSSNITMYDNNKGVFKLDWHTFKALPESILPDVVIGADIVYDPSLLQSLCDVITIIFKLNPNVTVYIASIIRNEETYDLFLRLLDKHCHEYQEMEINSPVHLNWEPKVVNKLITIKKS